MTFKALLWPGRHKSFLNHTAAEREVSMRFLKLVSDTYKNYPKERGWAQSVFKKELRKYFKFSHKWSEIKLI